jgi:hypothetical protein
MRSAPDLIHEPTLTDFVRALERRDDFNPDLIYYRNHSAAAYLQSQGWGSQFICPETTQFRHADFGDVSELDETITAKTSVEYGRGRNRRKYAFTRIHAQTKWVVAQQHLVAATTPLQEPQERKVPLTRGMLGVLALARRRKVLAAADLIWAEVSALPDLNYHPYYEERRLLRVPGAFVHDRAQLIFRTRSDYTRAPTRAQAASLRWLWPLHTATLLGNFINFLDVQDQTRPEIVHAHAAISTLQARECAVAPASMRREGERGPALASVLGRVFVIMRAHE